ncbi:PAS domain-containing protein [Algibacter mikhailovii]|uniref:PAS domain-containing protein n=1 Tax=Algibacter mikhailovii TaxID=425498 RepID=A0A918V5N4_9FLAO|nr:PAS domain-containing protein [Algibacter mikhailovii]GGZ71280.1 hypothetical protein GCM10007028_05630 [Algibacter mikhailovii]
MKIKQGPLKCWDIYAMHLVEQSKSFKVREDIKALSILKDKYKWNFNIADMLSNKAFDAIVLTSIDREILWVNKGFTKMTGYSTKFALGKQPSFLQGEKTTKASLDTIKTGLQQQSPFTNQIINYKKNGSLYNCELHIYPLKNKADTVTHFIAIEKELRLF